jgi:hypothetical protein
MRVHENRGLRQTDRQILRVSRIAEGCTKLHSKVHPTAKYYYIDKVEEIVIGGACGTHCVKEKCIQMCVEQFGCDGLEWTYLA